MKDIIKKNLERIEDPVKRGNALRENLQHLALKILDDGGFFKDICFVGGTALRVLYGLRRFSEDMDFSLQQPGEASFDFSNMLNYLTQELKTYELPVDTRTKQKGAVHSVFLKFSDALQEFGITKRRGQKLAIKLEIDTNPPPHARLETRLMQKDFMFTVVHHNLPTLFAGKTLAFLHRVYTKGRDIYDMIWFLTNDIKLNREFFDAGLRQQTSAHSKPWSNDDLRAKLIQRLNSLNMQDVIRDVEPFLDDTSEVRFFDSSLIRPLFQRAGFE